MDNFLTWDVILTYGGCVAGTVLVTEWFKKIFKNVPTQLVSFGIAAIILVIGHWATGTFAVSELLLYLVNAIAVSLAANGGFDVLKSTFVGVKQPDGELVFDDDEEGAPSLYATLGREPDQYEDGESVTFKIVKHSQE